MKRTEKDIFLFMETSAGVVLDSSLELITAARTISRETGGQIVALLPGTWNQREAERLTRYGLDMVIQIDEAPLADYSTARYTRVLHRLIQEHRPDVVMISATRIGKDLAPRLARRLGTGITANCTEVDVESETGLVHWRMPAPGGIMATILCRDTRPQMGTICPGAFEKPEADPAKKTEIIREAIDVGDEEALVELAHQVRVNAGAQALAGAEIVVAGGRGMGDRAGFQLIHELAHCLGAAAGASRAAVDSGFAAQQLLIGQTGTIIRPKLYIACGISGALQHMVGAEKAACIVAINRDREAPILAYADYAVIGDVREILPALIQALRP